MIILLVLLAVITAGYIFLRQPQFGALPAGERLDIINRSPNFAKEQFQNLSPTPNLTEGVSFFAVLKEFLFHKNKRGVPPGILPSVKTDLLSLDPRKNLVVWFGHSSYFMQVDGKRILIDPVLSGSASPVSFTTKSFKGSDVYGTDEIPAIDYLFITHDHWDHLDYQTVSKLKSKVKKVICGLGVGQHLEKWGYEKSNIIEKDWNGTEVLEPGFVVHTLPARHFSGRTFKRNGTLWMSYAFITPAHKIYLGGDSGYDTHFKTIGAEYGPFDLAILECGQYDKSWKYIHMMPEEVVQAALDLGAKKLMPVHWGKFGLANHAWDDPITAVSEIAMQKNTPLLTPQIGEAADLDGNQQFTAWWKTLS
jgi:L-ascorbate metabolism protein UlaG (beta-lactamase superfamily)